ncbi:unnamed protein product [Nippostrongylus brasiliensis]|uniref:Uncharacterized protein n=1 Tax=Nippostrongylus brasiliensis TaxID=27835 RepID=A0A0N4Y8M5_NIPBR|nr:unnamed protein product [Nippostrongylus brasiliensis]
MTMFGSAAAALRRTCDREGGWLSRTPIALRMKSDSYCDRMCDLMRRNGRTRFSFCDRSRWRPATDASIENAVELFRGLEIDSESDLKKVLLLQ